MDADQPNDEQLTAWLSLLRAPGLGPRRLLPLLQASAGPQQLLRDPPPQTPSQVRQALRAIDRERVLHDLDWLQQSGCRLLPIDSPDYPALLRELPDPPLALFVRGDAGLLHLPQLAIVGSRSASHNGIETARDFARFLAASGLVISSGLALGVDSAAHRGALLGGGRTLAVVGTGLDRVYPAPNRDLARSIADQGLLVSEFPPQTQPRAQNFPRRNRIIAALSLGTLVVEAALRSGSLITARLATELGREVFAIPGSIHNPQARGCHALIRDGAKLVECAEHVIEELGAQLGGLDARQAPDPGTGEVEQASDPDHHRLLQALGHEPASTDQLTQRTGFSAAEVSSMLLLLELQGHVSSMPGGLFTRHGDSLQ